MSAASAIELPLTLAQRARLDEIRARAARPGPSVVPVTPCNRYEVPARQLEVLAHAADGLTYGEIGKAVFISEETVRTHLSRLRDRS